MMKINRSQLAVPLLVALLLGGCVTTGKRGNDQPMTVYDLGPAPSIVGSGIPTLAVEVRVPAWLDGHGIDYRLNYAEPGRLREYSQARWAASPGALLQQRLVQELNGVAVGQGGAKCLVRVELDEFAQYFDTPQSSKGVIQARVSLLDWRRQRLDGKTVHLERGTESADAKGAVLALTTLTEGWVVDLRQWLLHLGQEGKFQGCGKAS